MSPAGKRARSARKPRITLRRRDVSARILAERGESLLITGLGSTCWDAAAVGDTPRNFYVWGGMGGAGMIGLGLALAQRRRRIVVMTGDGEMLMGLGSLATIAVQRPRNLAVVVMDNQRYGETGMQDTHTRHGVDLAGVAASAGFESSRTVYTSEEVDAAIPDIFAGRGPVFVNVKVRAEPLPMILPERDGPWLKGRFRRALLGEEDKAR